MSTTSVAPEQQRSSSGRTTPRRPSRHCALDDASFDDLVAMGQNIDDLLVEDYGTDRRHRRLLLSADERYRPAATVSQPD